MAIPPGTQTNRVLKAEIERLFDASWHHTLKNHAPHVPVNLPANSDLGLPAGARTLLCIFVGDDGFDLAIAYKHTSGKAEPLTDRLYHPTGVMVDGVWQYL